MEEIMKLDEAKKILGSQGYSVIKEASNQKVYIGTECVGFVDGMAAYIDPVIVTTSRQKAIDRIADLYKVDPEDVPVLKEEAAEEGFCVLEGELS